MIYNFAIAIVMAFYLVSAYSNKKSIKTLILLMSQLIYGIIQAKSKSWHKVKKYMVEEKNDMNREQMVEEFLLLFPEYRAAFDEHMENYGELLQYVFYAKAINYSLVDLLKSNEEKDKIKKYVGFIDRMWSEGDDSVVNVVYVTILERLSDDKEVWHNLGTYISEKFRECINKEVLLQNCAMWHVEDI